MCMEAGSDNLRIVLMYLSEKTVLEQLKEFPAMVDYVHKQYHKEVTWTLSDTPRAPLELIRKVYREGVAAGGDKTGISDTFGVATPPIMRFLARTVRENIPPTMALKIHCHNTFGLATANTLAAIEGGGTELDATTMGMVMKQAMPHWKRWW